MRNNIANVIMVAYVLSLTLLVPVGSVSLVVFVLFLYLVPISCPGYGRIEMLVLMSYPLSLVLVLALSYLVVVAKQGEQIRHAVTKTDAITIVGSLLLLLAELVWDWLRPW